MRLFPRAVNSDGLIAGSDPATGEVVTFDLTTQQTTRRGRGLVEGINDAGVVVGSMSGSHPDYSSDPFFGRPGQGLVNASVVAAPGPLRFSSVSDITNDGLLLGAAILVDEISGGPLKDPSGGRQLVPATLSIN